MTPANVTGVVILVGALVLFWLHETGILFLAGAVVAQKFTILGIRFWCWRERRRAEKRIRREMVSYYRRHMGRRPTRAELRDEQTNIHRYITPPSEAELRLALGRARDLLHSPKPAPPVPALPCYCDHSRFYDAPGCETDRELGRCRIIH
jgi:hypothetical protein